jgi:hypothetical protein
LFRIKKAADVKTIIFVSVSMYYYRLVIARLHFLISTEHVIT